MNGEDELDDLLNESFTDDDGEEFNDENSDIETENDGFKEEDNSLEALMSDSQEESKKKTDKSDKDVDSSKQINEQKQNKSRSGNNSKDLVDKDGNIIAKAGAERRFYEENVKLKRERDDFNNRVIPTIRQQYDAMVAKVTSYDQAFQAMKAQDMTPEDVNLGIELIRQWKQDPKKTIDFLLTQAKSYGINVNDDPTGINMQAINQMLDEKLKPFIQEREIRQKDIEVTNRARQVHDEFLNNYPDARVHTKELAYLVRQNPNLSLDAIYYKLKSHYAEKGYDFNTPLEEILQNRQTMSTKTSDFGSINTNQNVPMQPIKQNIASVSKSYDSIIKEALKSNKF